MSSRRSRLRRRGLLKMPMRLWKVCGLNERCPWQVSRGGDASGKHGRRQPLLRRSARDRCKIFEVAICALGIQNLRRNWIGYSSAFYEYAALCQWFLSHPRGLAWRNISQRGARPKIPQAESEGANSRNRSTRHESNPSAAIPGEFSSFRLALDSRMRQNSGHG